MMSTGQWLTTAGLSSAMAGIIAFIIATLYNLDDGAILLIKVQIMIFFIVFGCGLLVLFAEHDKKMENPN